MTVQNFVRCLKEFEAKVVINPLGESEVADIELRLNRRLPKYYREFLMSIGLKQDAIVGLTSKVEDFDPLIDFLPEGQAEKYFRFGDNGGEDYWLLRNDDSSDHNIYEYQYYSDGEINKLGKTFEDLLDESYGSLKANKENLVANSKKNWSVQFAIDTDNFDQIIRSLRREFDIENTQVSSAGVINSTGSMQLEGVEILIRKQEYKDWDSATYYFNWNEPVDKMTTNSFIKKVANRLRADGLKATLIDYGITITE